MRTKLRVVPRSLDHSRGVELVGADPQIVRVEERVVGFEVMHIVQPFHGEEFKGALDVVFNVYDIVERQVVQSGPGLKLLHEMEAGEQKVSELLVFEQAGVLDQSEHEGALADQEAAKLLKVEVIEAD